MENEGINSLGTVNLGDGFVGISEKKTISVIIASGQKLSKFCPIARQTVNKKHYKLDTTKTDGTEILRGFLGGDVDATTEDMPAILYVICEVDKSFVDAAYGKAMDADSYNCGNLIVREVK